MATPMEERMARVEATLPRLATKADLERAVAEMRTDLQNAVWKLAGLFVAIAAAAVAAARFLL